MPEIDVNNDLLQAAAERANTEQRSLTDVINSLLGDYAGGRTWLNLPDAAADRWWIATGILAVGGEKVLGPFGSQELALKVRTYMETAQQSAGDGRTYWVDEDETQP